MRFDPHSFLNPREMDVLCAIANGCTDQMTAKDLLLTDDQVAYAARTATLKLGASTRSHAVIRAVAAGVLEICPDSWKTTVKVDSQKSAQETRSRLRD